MVAETMTAQYPRPTKIQIKTWQYNPIVAETMTAKYPRPIKIMIKNMVV